MKHDRTVKRHIFLVWGPKPKHLFGWYFLRLFTFFRLLVWRGILRGFLSSTVLLVLGYALDPRHSLWSHPNIFIYAQSISMAYIWNTIRKYSKYCNGTYCRYNWYNDMPYIDPISADMSRTSRVYTFERHRSKIPHSQRSLSMWNRWPPQKLIILMGHPYATVDDSEIMHHLGCIKQC